MNKKGPLVGSDLWFGVGSGLEGEAEGELGLAGIAYAHAEEATEVEEGGGAKGV